MTGASDVMRVTARLRALQGVPGVSPRLAANCAALAARLGEPVRIGLFGLPGAGKLALLDALCASRLAPLAPLPTLELAHGHELRTEAILPDGSAVQSVGLPDADTLSRAPAFLRVHAPLPALQGRRFLLVACDADLREFAAALGWAAPRVDIALWCARGWSGLDAQLWGTAPESLANHAALVLTGDAAHAGGWHGAEGFEAVFRADPEGIARHLDQTAAEAAHHDLAAAEWMLQRHGLASEPIAKMPAGSAVASAAPNPAQRGPLPPTAPPTMPPTMTRALGQTLRQTAPETPPPEAKAELGRLFQYLRGAAARISDGLGDGPLSGEACRGLLDALAGIFDTLSERASDLDRAQETWPDLAAVLFEAQDMALLLRMEGGAEQAADAARLLLQLRHDMEVRLAA
ncbi:hypothetical protein [Salipiger aestuarii]|uniref:hypothetical protein n=1 Tax=Salipiger aestuarii TaxID=568098 RepID=UPI00123AC1C0|nr:hypothetical protein [Salipiger aestuarii]KAA8608253.1 hypothetical protein AL037_17360 [Salipiger aestuarii]